MLIAIGGLSGSGKSTIARALAGKINAVVIRSDVIRKQYFNVQETEPLPPEAYKPEVSTVVYNLMYKQALSIDTPVILDAVFLKPREREQASTLKRPFYGFWLEIDNTLAEQRILERKDDASDATVAVRRKQQAYLEQNPVTDWQVINHQSIDETVSIITAKIL